MQIILSIRHRDSDATDFRYYYHTCKNERPRMHTTHIVLFRINIIVTRSCNNNYSVFFSFSFISSNIHTLTGLSFSRQQLGNFSTSAPMLVSSPAFATLFTYTFFPDNLFTKMLPWSSIFTLTPCDKKHILYFYTSPRHSYYNASFSGNRYTFLFIYTYEAHLFFHFFGLRVTHRIVETVHADSETRQGFETYYFMQVPPSCRYSIRRFELNT